MTSGRQRLPYQTYLLRIWEEHGDDLETVIYRLSLEDPHTRQRYGFASVEQFAAFLVELTGAATTNHTASADHGEHPDT